ncbi:MAG: hypothetical protein AAF196_17780 [Planctomycetota bacterium]
MVRTSAPVRSGSLWLLGIVVLGTVLWGVGVFDGSGPEPEDVPGREVRNVDDGLLADARSGDSGHDRRGAGSRIRPGAGSSIERRDSDAPSDSDEAGCSLRVLDPEGEPVVDQSVIVQAIFADVDGQQTPRRLTRRTDSEGKIEVWALRRGEESMLRASVRTESRSRSEAPMIGGLSPELLSTIGSPFGPVDVQLEAATLLFHGRCVDDLSRPIEGVRVSESMWRQVSFGSPSFNLDENGGFTLRGLESGTVYFGGGSQGSPNMELVTNIVFDFAEVDVGAQSVDSQDVEEIGRVPASIPNLSSEFLEISGGELLNFQAFDAPLSSSFALTDEDGCFWLYGRAVESGDVQLSAVGEKDGYRNQSVPVPGIGAEVVLEMPRVVEIGLPVHVESGVPLEIFDLSIETEGGERVDGITLEASMLGEGELMSAISFFENVPAGSHRLVARLANRSKPLFVHEPLLVDPDAENPSSLQSIDLTGLVYAYELQAVGPRGSRLTELGSPLLIQQTGENGGYSAFAWSDGKIRFFAESPSVQATWFSQGYRLQQETIYAGEQALVFQPTQPLRLTLPGLRRLVGPDVRVRVSTILQSGTGLPQNLRATDQISRASTGFSRWNLSKSSGAWLGDTDIVDVPLTHDGSYEVVLRLRLAGIPGEHSIRSGVVQAQINGFGPDQHVVSFDRAAVEAGLAQLQASAAQLEAQQREIQDQLGRRNNQGR